ncbi:MAG: ATP-dependent DNA helicase RecQ [Bacteroidota bacterium]
MPVVSLADTTLTPDSPATKAALQQWFGFDALRAGQVEALEHVLGGEDTLVVMPTGAGKSLVYQLAAVLHDGEALPNGVTLVVSPLIALMKDQVDALQAKGIPAAAINSSMPAAAQREVMQQMRDGTLKLVYVAPERLRHRGFMNALRETTVALLAVDEAHCVSQWGHDFRPDYLAIGDARERMGRPQTVALTATATPVVQSDICATLGISHARQVVTGFNRPNLYFRVVSTPGDGDKRRVLNDFLEEHKDQPGLIYVGTRKYAESVTRFVRDVCKREVRAYHAGLTDGERSEVQDAFLTGGLDLVVATNAFGMGVDRADVRFVVHWAIPSTLEAYYQEAGRAGRDSDSSTCLLLYAPTDRQLREWFIDQAQPGEKSLHKLYRAVARQSVDDSNEAEIDVDALGHDHRVDLKAVGVRVGLGLLERMGALTRYDDRGPLRHYSLGGWEGADRRVVLEGVEKRRKNKHDGLGHMVAYAERETCRREKLVGYFGEAVEHQPERCCDACAVQARLREAPDEIPPFEALPMHSRIAIGLLDLVDRLRWSVGRKTLVRILTGSKAGDTEAKYGTNPYYGRLGFYRQDDVDGFYKQLLAMGYLKVGGEYMTVDLTALGTQALKHREAVPLDTDGPLPTGRGSASTNGARRSGSRTVEYDEAALTPDDAPLFEALREWRTQRATADAVPPYVVFSDAVLRAIAVSRPATDDDLLALKGIGAKKVATYGEDVLELVTAAA